MQGEVPLGPMNIGVIEDEDSGMSREDLLGQRNRLRVITANYDEGQIASVTASTYAGAMLDTLDTVNDWGIGRLLLPDVEMDLPILAGIANVNLVTGGSTYRMNQQLGECNYVLLAHSVYGNHNVLFQPLEFVQLGQRIYATDFLNVYTYEVTFNQVVLHDQVELLDQLGEEETPIITLMRCEGGIGTIHRRIVQGELVNVEPLESEGMARFNLIEDASDTRSQESETRNGNPEGALEENQEERTVGDNLPPLLMNHPISKVELLSVEFAARILSDPVQVALPLFLFLLFPMLFLSMLPSQPKGNKRKKEEDEVIEEMMKQLMEKIE
jgi:sortase A